MGKKSTYRKTNRQYIDKWLSERNIKLALSFAESLRMRAYEYKKNRYKFV